MIPKNVVEGNSSAARAVNELVQLLEEGLEALFKCISRNSGGKLLI